MASELLGYTARLPSSDLFSLGLTLYEMAFDLQRLRRNLVVLPSDGIHWHELRNGTYEKLRDRSPNLTSLIYALMSPEPTARPSGAALLTVEEVSRSKHEDCELLLSAQLNLAASFQYHRTQSFNPLMVPSEMDESALLVNGMRVITPH